MTYWSQDQPDKAEAPAALVNLLQGTANIWNNFHDDDDCFYDDDDYDYDDDNDDDDDDCDGDRNSRRVEKLASETLPIWRRHFTERSWWSWLWYFREKSWEEKNQN